MKTAITNTPDKGAIRARRLSAVGFTLALACLLATSPLRAADNQHGGGQQHPQGHSQGHSQGHGAPRQAYGHDDHRHGHDYGDQGYGYEAPPLAYAPQASPGISLFLPL
jgi:hypothetical protein